MTSFEQWRQSCHARWMNTDTFVQLSKTLRGTEFSLYAIASGVDDHSLLAVACVLRNDAASSDNWHISCEPSQQKQQFVQTDKREQYRMTIVESLQFLPWAF